MVRYLFYTIGDLTYQSPLVVIQFLPHREEFDFIVKKNDECCMDIAATDCSRAAPLNTLCGQKVNF